MKPGAFLLVVVTALFQMLAAPPAGQLFELDKLALWLALSLSVYVFLYTALIGFTVAKT